MPPHQAGDIAILSWAGSPADPESDVAGVEWIRAVDWVPYQRSTFVTPGFASLRVGPQRVQPSGREVLTLFTESEFFPGGLSEHSIEAGSFLHENGPTEEITLQWATYRDAADEAGRSRIWGGIHIPADDAAGREIGRKVGEAAWLRAQNIFDGQI